MKRIIIINTFIDIGDKLLGHILDPVIDWSIKSFSTQKEEIPLGIILILIAGIAAYWFYRMKNSHTGTSSPERSITQMTQDSSQHISAAKGNIILNNSTININVNSEKDRRQRTTNFDKELSAASTSGKGSNSREQAKRNRANVYIDSQIKVKSIKQRQTRKKKKAKPNRKNK